MKIFYEILFTMNFKKKFIQIIHKPRKYFIQTLNNSQQKKNDACLLSGHIWISDRNSNLWNDNKFSRWTHRKIKQQYAWKAKSSRIREIKTRRDTEGENDSGRRVKLSCLLKISEWQWMCIIPKTHIYQYYPTTPKFYKLK